MGIGSAIGGAAGKAVGFGVDVVSGVVNGAASLVNGFARMVDGGAPNPMTEGFEKAVGGAVGTVGGALSSGAAQAGAMAGDTIDRGLGALGTFPSPITHSTGSQTSQDKSH